MKNIDQTYRSRFAHFFSTFLLCLITLALLTGSRASYASPTVNISAFTAMYSPTHAEDEVDIGLTGSYSSPTQSGHWILYEVVTITYLIGTKGSINIVLASGNYTSGQVVKTTQYPYGSSIAEIYADQSRHLSYHYELLDEVLDNGIIAIVSTTQNTPEQAIY